MTTLDGKTDYSIVRDLTRHVKSNSYDGIQSCLTRLKNDPKCVQQLVRDGGLGLLITLLKSTRKIQSMSLSILADACMASDARKKVKGSKIDVYSLIIVKNVKLLGTITHCRACRLIGNLVKCEWHAKCLYDAGLVRVLESILQRSTDAHTYGMVIRAFKNIWSTYVGSRRKILDLGVIKSIMELLLSAKEKSITELVNICLKAMCTFLCSLDPRCGEQMQGGKDRQGYKCILEYCSENNRLAKKCLYNLCQIPVCRLVLGSAGAVETIISFINEYAEPSKEILLSLCMFCLEAVNRARIKESSGLQSIIILLKKSEYERYHPMLLQALMQFVFDDPSMVILVQHGLLDVLVENLKIMVDEALYDARIENISKKRLNESSCAERTGSKYTRTDAGRYSLDYYPGSSGSHSPSDAPLLLHFKNATADEKAEDNCSSVHSGSEWDENEEEDSESLKSCKSTSEMEDSQETVKSQKTNNRCVMNISTLALLFRLSRSAQPIERMVDRSTIRALSMFIKHARNSMASKILTNIVRNEAYLIPLVKQGFVFELQTLHDSEQYMEPLRLLAETGGAVGEFSSILLRAEENHKLVIAVSIPFLIVSRATLKSLLKTNGGLQLIFRALIDQEHYLFENAISSICRLASTLQIQPEVLDKYEFEFSEGTDFQRADFDVPRPTTVTFELDDGTTVDACRETLCQRSAYFSAMLEGNFYEAGKRRVKLRKTSKEGLKTLMLAANGATFENRSIESLLDAILLADKFLMTDVSDALTESSLSKLNYENFYRVWNWARKNSCHEFKSCCVKIFLTREMSTSERVRAFRDFFACENFDEFLNEIKSMIVEVLCQH